MGEKHRTVLIYIVDDAMQATKIDGDDAWVYTQIVAEALKLLKEQAPEKFEIFTQLKTTRVRLLVRKVTGPEFDKITKQQKEDQE